jgi:lipoprotein-releasing system permease protein
LSLLTSEGIHTPFGFFPKVYTVWVAGFFESGVYDYDLSLVFTPHSQLKEKIVSKERVIEVKLRDPFLSSELKNRLIRNLGLKARVVDWQELNRNLFSALKLEKFGLFVVLSLMVGVSLFTVISAMVMLVSEKRLDLGILRALGAKKKEVERLFFFCGFILSFFGVVLGLALGSILCLVLSKYPVIKLPEEVYPVEYLPISLEVSDLILISAVTLVLGVLSALYPARKASGLNPAEILRKEG